MAEKGGTKILVIITICVVLISIGFSGCIGDDGDENKEIIFVYEVNGVITGEFQLIIPTSLNDNQEAIFLESDYSIIDGEISFKYVETEFGLGLQILGNNSFHLKATTQNQRFTLFSLSVENISKNDDNYYGKHNFRIYLNSTHLQTMEISISCYDNNEVFGVNVGYIEKSIIKNGWQEIEGLYTKLVE